MMKKDIVIKVENLTKIYHLYDKPHDRLKEALNPFNKSYHHDFYAMNDVSFEVKRGEIVGIIGKNGAGKSTLLKMITGVLTPTSGNIEVHGKIASLLELGAGFNPEMTGMENIYLNGTLMGLNKEQIDKKINNITEFADIGDFIFQAVKTYSSGMFARLAFSVAINVEPDILIVDEALSVGDVFFQQKCNLYMKEHMRSVTKLIVTHDLATLANMTNKAILIENGIKLIEGEPSKVIEQYQKTLHNKLFKKKIQQNDSNNISQDKSKAYLFQDIEKKSLGGSLEVEADKIALSINHEEFFDLKNIIIYPDSRMAIKVLITVKKDLSNMIVGYIIKDKYGNSIFGENTVTSLQHIPSLEKNKKYIVDFIIDWPEIQEGDYFLTIGFGEGTDPLSHNILCWAHNIVKITSALKMNTIVHCLFNNKIKDFKIREV